MDPSISLQVALWVWIIIGVALVIGASAFAFSEDGGEIGEPWPVPVFLGLGLGGSGLLALALAAAGWPSIALYVWRGTAVVVTFLGVVIFFRNRRNSFSHSLPPGFKPAITSSGVRWSAAIATLLLSGFTLLSFQRHSLPKSAELIVSNAGMNAPGQITPSLSSLIWSGALILLAVGTLIFLVLFAQRLRDGGAPKLETHWEGIGGGLGGWRMSSSLGYLVVAGLLALLFTVFLFRFDAREHERDLEARASPTPTVAPR